MRIEMVGTAPLLMHNVRLADDQDPYVREIKKLTAKKTKKTEEDKLEIDRLSFAGGLYYDEELGPYLPAENIFRCLMEAGSLTRSGKKIERGVIFESTRARLEYDGPRDIEKLWGDNGDSPFVDRRMVAVQRQRIPRVRPIFPDWSASIGVDIDPQVIDPEEFQDIVEKAGKLIGIGDYRRFYGKFIGAVTD
ncbi:hypothetical protein [Amycolatopsis thermoflava]|uniref:hypothetical protein n=1 Tax=Amycolatopsis thermoflava TaxID=84480 RepID=UPI0003F999B3|nr:hypothetical protein [Amycolatopsis thermoflava]